MRLSAPRISERWSPQDIERSREEADLAECSFKPRIGRPPQNRVRSKSVEERLYQSFNERRASL